MNGFASRARRDPGFKVASLIAGIVADAEFIDDMAMLRHGEMGRAIKCAYAPSTLGLVSFARSPSATCATSTLWPLGS